MVIMEPIIITYVVKDCVSRDAQPETSPDQEQFTESWKAVCFARTSLGPGRILQGLALWNCYWQRKMRAGCHILFDI